MWQEADLQNWGKLWEKRKLQIRELNNYIIAQREKDRYFEEKGYFPEEHDWPEWKQGIERSRYVKELTEANPTSSAKRPSRSKKGIDPPKKKQPWRPPPH